MRICDWCSREISGRKDKKYCNRICKTEAYHDSIAYRQWRSNWQRTQRNKGYRVGRSSYVVHKGPICTRCGFVPLDKCQLDVDHIDGNHKNNEVDNLQTLCANCHRLKTFKPDLWEGE